MGISLKVGSVLSFDLPASFRVMPMDATVASATVANGVVTITAIKAGTTWLHLVGGTDFSGMLMLNVVAK